MLKSTGSIGLMDRRGTFLKPVYEVGASNEEKITGWVPIDVNPTVWAWQRENVGDEIMTSDKPTYAQVKHFGIRWREDISVLNQWVVKGQKYSITSINEIEQGRKRYLSIATAILENEMYP